MHGLEAEINRLKHEIESIQHGDAAGEQIYVGQYLLDRLAQLGVKSIFGVPGDFNLGFLDLVEDHPALDWIGNCNELNAGYAADGYARVKDQSLGVVITTFGVGELSAVNAIAGAFSEHVPILHIVGVPNTTQLKEKPMLHHTLGDGRFDAYTKAAEQFTAAQANLMEKATTAVKIDALLTDAITLGRPVYLTLPTDLCYEKIPSGGLRIPLSLSPPPNDPEVEEFVLNEIIHLVEEAQQDVIILVDACAIRHHVKEELKEFLERTHFPVFSAPMGKTTVSEGYERYGGMYVGSISHPAIKEKVENARLVLSVGALKSDFNTGNFTYRIPTSKTVELHSDHTMVRHGKFAGIGMKHLLPKLTARLQPYIEDAKQLSVPTFKAVLPHENHQIISHAWLWPRVSAFFGPKDVIVAETGTATFGIIDVPLPDGAVFVSQILWGSIGWTVGSTLGAGLAARELGMGRIILFIGDGSIQLTVQELSTMIRVGLKPIIFLLNNSGYTIERYLHGKHRKYNDIANWKWTSLLDVFGDGNTVSKSYTVRTKDELSKLLDDDVFTRADKIQLVEVMMEKLDAPRGLQVQAELSGKTNQYTKGNEWTGSGVE